MDGRMDGQRENSIPHHKQSLGGDINMSWIASWHYMPVNKLVILFVLCMILRYWITAMLYDKTILIFQQFHA